MPYSLEVQSQANYEYRVVLKNGVAEIWWTYCPEIDLDETVSKVLRTTDNLRHLPGTTS
jgi:hypothetical protein